MTAVTEDAGVNDVLASFARASRLLAGKGRQLRSQPEMSDIKHGIRISGPLPDEDFDDALREHVMDARRRGLHQVVVWGWVEAAPKDARSVAWAFNICDARPAGWRLIREVCLTPTEGDDRLGSLPDVVFPDWAALARSLPGMVEELVAQPVPHGPT